MTKLTDLQNLALEIIAAKAATNAVRDHAGRMAALEAVRVKYAGQMPVNGVCVYAIVPGNRTVFRRTHTRFQYYVNGKRATEVDARRALEGDA